MRLICACWQPRIGRGVTTDTSSKPLPRGYAPHPDRQRAHLIRQFLALIPQCLSLGLGGRIGDRQPPLSESLFPRLHLEIVYDPAPVKGFAPNDFTLRTSIGFSL